MTILNKSVRFQSDFCVSGCLCLYNNKFLILKKINSGSFPNHWGIPSGRLEKNESSIECAMRELHEETNISSTSEKMYFIDTFNIKNNQLRFIYSIFILELTNIPEVQLSHEEHCEYRWVEFDDLSSLLLIPDVQSTVHIAIKKHEAIKVNEKPNGVK